MYGQADGSIIIDTELDSQGFEAGSKELESAINSFEKTISKIGQSLNSLGPTFTRALQGSGSAINSFDSKIGKVDESLAKARDEIANMENQLNSLGNAQIPTEEYTRLTNLIDTTGAKIDELVYKQRQLEESDSNGVISRYLELKDQISSTEAQLEKLRALQSEMQSSSGDYSSADFARVKEEIASAEVNLEALNMEMRELESSSGAASKIGQYQALQTQIEQLGATADTAVEKMAAMEQDGTAYTIGSKTAKYQQLEATLRGLKSEYDRSAAAASSMKSQLAGTNAQVSTTSNNTQKLSNRTNTLRRNLSRVGSVGKAAFSAIGSRVRSAASSMLSLLTHTKSTKSQFSGLISSAKKFTLSLLGARGVYALLRKAVSQYMSENEELSNTLTSVWSGIGNILGPIITKLINLVATATSYVTNFLKLFNWFGTSTSSSLDDATESAKDLKRALASFDDLNVLNYSDSSSDSDDDSSSTSLPDVTLPDWAKQVAEMIKKGNWAGAATVLADQLNSMIDSLDWAGYGTKIGKLFNGVLSFIATFIKKFDWTNLGSKLGTFLTNLIKNVDWSNLGVLLVAKWSILLQLLVGFFDTFSGKDLSNALHQLIKGAINAVDWVDLSGRLGKKLTKFIGDINWWQLGQDVADGFATIIRSITAFISNLDGKTITSAFTNFIKGALSVNWAKVFGDLAKSLSDYLMEADFGDVAKTLSSIITTALDSMTAVVDNTDFGGLGKQLSNFVNNIDYKGIISKLGQLIGKILIGAFKLINSFTEGLDFDKIADGFVDGIVEILKNVDWAQLAGLVVESIVDSLVLPIKLTISIVKSVVTNAVETGKEIGTKIGTYIREHIEAADGDISQGLYNALEDAISSVTESVKTWVNQYIIDPILRMFGLSDEQIAELKANFAENFPKILAGVPDAIRRKFDEWIENLKNIDLTKVGEFAGRVAATIVNWLKKNVVDRIVYFFEHPEEFFKNVGKVITWIFNVGKEIVSGLFRGLATLWEKLKEFVKGFIFGWTDTLEIGSPSKVFERIGKWIIEGLLAGIKAVWSSITTFFSNGLTAIKNGFSTAWSNIKSAASTAWSGIKSTLSSAWNGIKSTASSTWSGIKSTLSSKWNEMKSNASSTWSNIKFSLSSTWDNIRSTASSKFDSVKSTIQNKGWYGIGSNIISGIQNGITSGWNWLINTVSNVANSLLNTAKNVLGIHSPSTVFRDEVGLNIGYGIGEGIEDSESYVLKSVSGIADAIAEEAAVDIPPIQYAESSVVTGLDKVADKLSYIESIFQSIADMLTSMGGLKIPQIATGTVVPYANRSEAVLSPTGASGALPAEFADNVDEQFDTLADLLRQLIELVRSKNLNIDLKALTDMITKLQRENTRNFGGAL